MYHVQAHGRAVLVERFVTSVAALTVSVALKKVLTQLSDLYAIYTLLNNSGDFFMVRQFFITHWC
jgi:hypothetical protein